MPYQRPLTVVAVVFSCLSATAAQSRAQIEFRKVGGKTIECQRMPPSSNLNECGFRPDWFWGGDDYVFVGSISAVSPDGKEEKKLQISPEEVLRGEPLESHDRTDIAERVPAIVGGRGSVAFFPKEGER